MSQDTPALRTVRLAAAGVGSQIAWQVWSRGLAFAVKSVAIRAVGPAHFAFTEIRLGLLTVAASPVALATRSVALRVPRDDTAAALVLCSTIVTAVLAGLLGTGFAFADPAHAGPILLTALQAALNGMTERGRVFAARRERYSDASRARALARVVGGIVTSASVFLLPSSMVGLYAVVVGNVAHAMTMKLAFDRAVGDAPIPRVAPWTVHRFVETDNVKMTAIEIWQRMFKTVLTNGESVILDLTCVDPIKGAYQLAANVASMLARFFSEALEEQSFSLFSRLSSAFNTNVAKSSETIDNPRFDEAAEMRAQCIQFLHMSLKLALLVSLLVAVVGPCFSYAFLRLLYGVEWADKTPAPQLLGLYFVYLVFMAANGVTEALFSATASTRRLQQQSVFSVVLSFFYMIALFLAGRSYSAQGIIAVNCANMAARTLYSVLYYTELTQGPASALISGAAPSAYVVSALVVGRVLCGLSERYFFRSALPKDTLSATLVICQHGVSGAASVALFLYTVYAYERPLRLYLRLLHGKQSLAKASDSSGQLHES
jgi:Rft protein